MKQRSLFFLAAIMASSCAANSPAKDTNPAPPVGVCAASQLRGVQMWINAMPGVNTGGGYPLLVNFTATTPTPGYSFALQVNRVMESFPEQVVLDLVVTPPTGIVPQVVQDNQVKLRLPNFPGSEGSSVQVNCEDAPFFKVDKVMAAH